MTYPDMMRNNHLMYPKWLPGLLLVIALLSACSTEIPNEVEPASSPTPQEIIAEPTAESIPVQVIGDCVVDSHFTDRTSCITVSVTCANLPAATAELRITSPNPARPYLGTVLLGSGGAGHSFLAREAPTPSSPSLKIVNQLAAAGYKVVERKWQNGWFGPDSEGLGIITPACRHSELLKWLDQEAESPGALCAFGNSGGSSEIAYGLTRWNTETILDAVILGAGPPMARLDIGCLGNASDPTWQQTCSETWTSSQTQCGQREPVCTLYDRPKATGPQAMDAAFSIVGLNDLCTGSSTTFGPLFLEESVLFPGADLAYPETAVHFIYSHQDCTEAAILGPLYYEAITTGKTVEYLDDVGHETQDFEAGADAIIQAVTEYCTVNP